MLERLLRSRPNEKRDDHHPGWYREPGTFEELPPPEPVVHKASWIKNQVNRFRKWARHVSYTDFLKNTFYTIVAGVVLALVGFGGYSLYKTTTANGLVNYCYIERWTYIKEKSKGDERPRAEENKEEAGEHIITVWELKGHRSWRDDRNIGRFSSFEDAIAGAKKIDCRIESNDANVSQ